MMFMKEIIKKYKTPIKFTCSSMFSALIDLIIFRLLMLLPIDKYMAIGIGTVVARIISSIVNFIINKWWSFESKGKTTKEAMQFFILFLVKMLLSSGMVSLLSNIPIDIVFIKMFVDILLFFMAYYIQKKYIFKGKLK